jgi:tRNA A-37 threonylcarbamoyl transferase component Bud32
MSAPDGGPVRIGNRYRIEEPIGTGAMGAVWRAVDELLGRTVAVKELLSVMPGTSGTEIEESRQRILREGRIGARLQHANVISMFDVVIHEDSPWLVMEYLSSESLAARLAVHGRLAAAEVAEIGRQMADGLAAAHLAGVVHRDVKPGNVLIAANGLVKLTDFGVSRAVDEVQLTRTGLIAGTPAYLAPEVAQGREPTAASDVFALGATLYAAVEGTPPFGLDDNAYALLHKVATVEPEPPRQAGPLAGVLMRLLSVDPEDRPSAAQARDLLAAVAAGGVEPDAGPIGVLRSVDASRKTEGPRSAGVDGRRRRVPALLGLFARRARAGRRGDHHHAHDRNGQRRGRAAGQPLRDGRIDARRRIAGPRTPGRDVVTTVSRAPQRSCACPGACSSACSGPGAGHRPGRVRSALLRPATRQHRCGVRAARAAGAEPGGRSSRICHLLRPHAVGDRV